MRSIYRQLLGSDFARLHPQIPRRFGFSSADVCEWYDEQVRKFGKRSSRYVAGLARFERAIIDLEDTPPPGNSTAKASHSAS
jgi:hypothetical protein